MGCNRGANSNFVDLGYVTIAIFALCWLASILIYRAKRFDEFQIDRWELK